MSSPGTTPSPPAQLLPSTRPAPSARPQQPEPGGVAPFEPPQAPHQFSIISLMAFAGLWMTSPAAMRFTTASSSRRITPAIAAATGAEPGLPRGVRQENGGRPPQGLGTLEGNSHPHARSRQAAARPAIG